MLSAEEQGLVTDLRAVDVVVGDVWDLVNTRGRYPAAVGVLMSWLERLDATPASAERERFREGLIRALTVRDARPAAAPLMIYQFRTTTTEPIRWAAGNAIGETADAQVFAEVVDLVRRRSFGVARQMPVYALPRIGGKPHRDIVIDVLVELLADDDVALHAISAVRRLRAPQARQALRRLLDHQSPAIRRRTRDALDRL
jgi:HEAT repeat protein